MINLKKENYNIKQYLQEIVQNSVDIFHELTSWSDADRQEYSLLLTELKKPFDKEIETTKAKGDRLENLVSSIIKKSYFFEIYRNVHTGTNEIDEVISLSSNGKQALSEYNLSRDLLEIDSDIALGECKNYDSTLDVTYVGKFYSLLVSTDIPFGIIFTQKGLTGNENEYHDSHGLVKVLRIIEKYQNNRDLTILTFTLEDYEKLERGISFFELIKAKKIALQLSSSYENFIKEYHHDGVDLVKQKLMKVKSQR